MIPPGFYRDCLDPSGLIEVIGEGVDAGTGSRRVVVRVPGSESLKLIKPIDFIRPMTVKDGEGTAQVTRFMPISEDFP